MVSAASRIMSLVYRVGLEEDLTITGGVAKNIGVVTFLEKKLGIEAKKLPVDPQLMGALGAALSAKRKHNLNSFFLIFPTNFYFFI